MVYERIHPWKSHVFSSQLISELVRFFVERHFLWATLSLSLMILQVLLGQPSHEVCYAFVTLLMVKYWLDYSPTILRFVFQLTPGIAFHNCFCRILHSKRTWESRVLWLQPPDDILSALISTVTPNFATVICTAQYYFHAQWVSTTQSLLSGSVSCHALARYIVECDQAPGSSGTGRDCSLPWISTGCGLSCSGLAAGSCLQSLCHAFSLWKFPTV